MNSLWKLKNNVLSLKKGCKQLEFYASFKKKQKFQAILTIFKL
jgi:hypothetical protein